VKFAHLADAHLGYEQYHLPFRAEDFARSFKMTVERAIEEDVDFAVMSGDLFHRSSPNPKTIKQAIDILSMFKRENIPVFAIEGNHDKTIKEVSIYDLLESLKLLHKLGLRRKFVKDEFVESKKIGDVYLVYGKFGDLKIVGDTHRSSYHFKQLMESRYLPSGDIVVLHGSIKEIVDVEIKDDYIPMSLLPKAKYYALGHVHIPIAKEVNGSWYVYPGCPERSDAKEYSLKLNYFESLEIVKGISKGFFIVKDFKPKFIDVQSRDMVLANVYAVDQKDAEVRVKEILNHVDSESILILKIFSERGIDVEGIMKLTEGKVKHVRISFERISKDRDIKFVKPNEFFTEFELSLFEYLRRSDFEDLIGIVINLVEKEFGLRDVKTIEDYSKLSKVERETAEVAQPLKKEVKSKRPRTLLDFLEG